MMMMKEIQSYSRSSKKWKSHFIGQQNTLISIFCSALLQTLKPNLEIVNVILNIPITNDGEQHKDNNNSIT